MTEQLWSSPRAWLDENYQLLTLVVAAIALIRWASLAGFFARTFLGRASDDPRIEFALERVAPISGEDQLTFDIKVANVAGGVASDIRFIWNRRSTCILSPVPQPFMLMTGESKILELSMAMVEAVVPSLMRLDNPVLGWIELNYSVGHGRRKSIRKAAVLAEDSEIPIDLGPAPRKTLEELIPLYGKLKQRRESNRYQQAFADWLAQSRLSLIEHDIEPTGADDEKVQALLGELGSRGWRWEMETGGQGYEVHAEKSWWPSTSMSMRFSATTLIDAVTLVLAGAISEDEQREQLSEDALLER